MKKSLICVMSIIMATNLGCYAANKSIRDDSHDLRSFRLERTIEKPVYKKDLATFNIDTLKNKLDINVIVDVIGKSRETDVAQELMESGKMVLLVHPEDAEVQAGGIEAIRLAVQASQNGKKYGMFKIFLPTDKPVDDPYVDIRVTKKTGEVKDLRINPSSSNGWRLSLAGASLAFTGLATVAINMLTKTDPKDSDASRQMTSALVTTGSIMGGLAFLSGIAASIMNLGTSNTFARSYRIDLSDPSNLSQFAIK